MISPSRTNWVGLSPSTASTSSGKYRARGCPDFDWRWTLSPSLKARHLNPSHLGSYSHPSSAGISSTVRASIGRYGGFIGRVMVLLNLAFIDIRTGIGYHI